MDGQQQQMAERHQQELASRVNDTETLLTPEEEKMDLSGMTELNLGEHDKYKTKIV
eukprot:CAMPEP_0170492066 /NCGR_PEP_ID=MMETSP0208-20121228/11614_1 /TAXON_ID=197538 /ORGANISM="Strombidium inclinatum, Strain S3" /LENGTH=55 /DNA_ID=CAMNT_0010767753 /DNA_START=12 /DNA_END=179 /DNA_ORIENTATION=+